MIFFCSLFLGVIVVGTFSPASAAPLTPMGKVKYKLTVCASVAEYSIR